MKGFSVTVNLCALCASTSSVCLFFGKNSRKSEKSQRVSAPSVTDAVSPSPVFVQRPSLVIGCWEALGLAQTLLLC